jgi:hypothetical protein
MAKAKWQVQGERNTHFFYLEKKHFTEKNISKLVVDKTNQVVEDLKDILTEQNIFSQKLY